MCGICGYWPGGDRTIASHETLMEMTKGIAYRGPDSSGQLVTNPSGPGMAHARLSVIDISESGAQPMSSVGKRFVIVYNGETYNHLELRDRLEKEGNAPLWRGHSDTETVLACFEAWGIETTLERMIGMFAFAVWDYCRETLVLARDRLGEKPLYYGLVNGDFLFGSELSALHRYPDLRVTIDRNALTAFVERSYVPGPHSIYSEIKKLQPGNLLTVARRKDHGIFDIESRPYWTLSEQMARGPNATFSGSANVAVDALDKLLTEVIEEQMISDVPLGAFLSGGIDSSLVTALMQKVSPCAVKTFSIGFEDRQFDESESARSVASHLGTDHTELIVTPEHIMGMVSRIPDIYCEPFADSSQLPTYIVSALAKEHVTVALTGDGADEIFGGYNRYVAAASVWRYASRIPMPIRSVIGVAALAIPKSSWDSMFSVFSGVLPHNLRARFPGEKIHKIGRLLKQSSKRDYYRSLISMTDDAKAYVLDGVPCRTTLEDISAQPCAGSFEEWMMALDTLTYLPDDICVKVDRAAMANSLETRAPFLDRRIVEFGWSLPLELKLRGKEGKWVLRELLSRYVPRDLFERPKMGFGIPFGKWLRGPLHDWADDLLSEDRLVSDGYFSADKVRSVWLAHNAGYGNNEYLLWNILMFNAWLDRWERK